MTSSTGPMNGMSAAEGADGGHLGDTGPMYADVLPSKADIKARGAANRMWRKVQEDLERIDRAPNKEGDDE